MEVSLLALRSKNVFYFIIYLNSNYNSVLIWHNNVLVNC